MNNFNSKIEYMERRKVIKFFPWVLSVFGLGVAQANVLKRNTSSPEDLNKYHILKAQEVYVLPVNPQIGESIVFINEGQDWEKSPPVVKSKSFNINGKANEDLLVDLNQNFGLRFLGKTSGWQYFKA